MRWQGQHGDCVFLKHIYGHCGDHDVVCKLHRVQVCKQNCSKHTTKSQYETLLKEVSRCVIS